MHLFEEEKSGIFFYDGLFYAGLVLVYQCDMLFTVKP